MHDGDLEPVERGAIQLGIDVRVLPRLGLSHRIHERARLDLLSRGRGDGARGRVKLNHIAAFPSIGSFRRRTRAERIAYQNMEHYQISSPENPRHGQTHEA